MGLMYSTPSSVLKWGKYSRKYFITGDCNIFQSNNYFFKPNVNKVQTKKIKKKEDMQV